MIDIANNLPSLGPSLGSPNIQLAQDMLCIVPEAILMYQSRKPVA